jgi:hypothetical protein
MTGYLSPLYAKSLRTVGEPFELPQCGGWLLRRYIHPGAVDAMGCYPLFACRDWSALASDVESLNGQLVALSLVPDPFGDFDGDALKKVFPEVCRPFKQHFVVDLRRAAVLPSHHRRNLRIASRAVAVECCRDPSAHVSDLTRLYQQLVIRRAIHGFGAFTKTSLEDQLKVPGLLMLRALRHGECVGMTLWYERDDVAYYHLGAFSEAGYSGRASYALFEVALEMLRERVHWVDLGGGAGVTNTSDGLTRFKSGWANSTRMAFFCGRVFDRAEYRRLANCAPATDDVFFPAYRAHLAT